MSLNKKPENGKFVIADEFGFFWVGDGGKFNQNKFQIVDLIKRLFVRIDGMI